MVLRVKLEVVPYGNEDKAYEIGRVDIFNKGTLIRDGKKMCEYGVIQLDKKNTGLFDDSVFHYREHGAWTLVHTVLDNLCIDGPE
jgi:hypothetical protein